MHPLIASVVAVSSAVLLVFSVRSATGIACYSYDFVYENISLDMDCVECKKVHMMFNLSDTIEITQQWQCEKDTKASRCSSGLEIVAASYRADSSSESRLCTCCSDYCNGLVGFCSRNNSLVERIKHMIDLPPSEPYQVFEEIDGHLIEKSTTPPPANQEIMSCYNDSTSSINKTTLLSGCKECRKIVRRDVGKVDEISWECVKPLAYYSINGRKKCSPFVSATVSTDGISSVQAYCSCCHDACNDAQFCILETISPGVKVRSAKKNNLFSLDTPAKITMSAVLLITFLLLASQRIYNAIAGP